MREKKGDTMNYVITGILAVLILVAVFYLIFGTKLLSFFGFLPNLNTTVDVVGQKALVRYDISDGKVMYYDGTEWSEFVKLTLKDKNVVKTDSLKKDFEKYYYEEKREGRSIKIGMNLINLLNLVNGYNGDKVVDKEDLEFLKGYNSLGNLDLFADAIYVPGSVSKGYRENLGIILETSGENFNNGDIKFWLRIADGGKGGGAGFILSSNKMKLVYLDEQNNYKTSEFENYGKTFVLDAYNGMKKWRDSIFGQTIKVSYEKGEGIYCAELNRDKFIIIDLNKIAAEGIC